MTRWEQQALDLLPALAAGEAAPELTALLRVSQLSKRLLLLRAVLDSAPAAYRARLVEAWEVIAAAEGFARGPVREVLAYPTVGTWISRSLSAGSMTSGSRASGSPATGSPAPRNPAPGNPAPGPLPSRHWAYLETVALSVALTAGLPVDWAVPVGDGPVVLPALGVVPPGERGRLTLHATAEGTGLRRNGEPVGWRPAYRLAALGGGPLLEDGDPMRDPGLAAVGSLPGVAPPLDLEGRASWRSHWVAARRLLGEVQPSRAREVDELLRCVVPLRPALGGEDVTVTFGHTFGQLLTTPGRDAAQDAALLTHETQHLKLFAFGDLVALHEPDDAPRFQVPWRRDGRPVGGLLHGVYAHLAMAEYWTAVASGRAGGEPVRLRARAEAARCLRQLGSALPLLDRAPLTAPGRGFVAGLAKRLDRASLAAKAGVQSAYRENGPSMLEN